MVTFPASPRVVLWVHENNAFALHANPLGISPFCDFPDDSNVKPRLKDVGMKS